MLTAIPERFLAWNFDILQDGETIAHLRMAWIREKGELIVGKETYEIGRERPFSGKFVLAQGGSTIASAVKPSAFRRAFEVNCNFTGYDLEPASAFTRTFCLFEGEREVGTIRPAHVFTRRAEVDLPESLPLATRIFITWLVILLWKRAAESD